MVQIDRRCQSCSCHTPGNVMKLTASLALERLVHGEASSCKPDITGYNSLKRAVVFHEIAVNHRPEPATYEIAKEIGATVLVYPVKSDADLSTLRSGILTPEGEGTTIPSCACEKYRCGHCDIPRCQASGHFYCPQCRACINEALDPHRHCDCGELIYGRYVQCFCCSIGCVERRREHRHCSVRACRVQITSRDRLTGAFYEKCRKCHQSQIYAEVAEVRAEVARQSQPPFPAGLPVAVSPNSYHETQARSSPESTTREERKQRWARELEVRKAAGARQSSISKQNSHPSA